MPKFRDDAPVENNMPRIAERCASSRAPCMLEQQSVGGPQADYTSVRAEVVKAYAQQAEEVAQALSRLQQAGAGASAAIGNRERLR